MSSAREQYSSVGFGATGSVAFTADFYKSTERNPLKEIEEVDESDGKSLQAKHLGGTEDYYRETGYSYDHYRNSAMQNDYTSSI